MRLKCPNCSAQYEIDASLIPVDGRDVQCSSCGHTWFQLREQPAASEPAPLPQEPAEAPDWGVTPEDLDEDEISEEDVAPRPASAAVAPAPSPVPAPTPSATPHVDDEDGDEEPVPEPAAAVPSPRPVDKAVLDILKEEADREMAARRGEAAPIETQADFGAATQSPEEGPSRAWRERVSRIEYAEDMRRREEELEAARAYEKRNKSELLPDIEDINSSLTPDHPASDGGHGSFRAGFALTLGLAAVLLLAYVYAAEIATAVPATEPILISYVDVANAARDRIDALLAGG